MHQCSSNVEQPSSCIRKLCYYINYARDLTERLQETNLTAVVRYLLLLVVISTPFDKREASDLEMWRRDERYSRYVLPLNVKLNLEGTIDWIASNTHDLISLHCRHKE